MASDPRCQAQALCQVLQPEHWPVPLAALPPATALVGGAVRDGLLGRQRSRPDLDLVVPGDAIAVSRELARDWGGSAIVLDAERSIARLVVRGWTVDLARCVGGSLTADLARRDYSINAIALPLRPAPEDAIDGEGSQGIGMLIDPQGGIADLRARQLVAISETNLLEDPLRLLRGARLAAELDFTIEPTTLAWLERHHRRLGAVAGERVLAELERLVRAPAAPRGLDLALRTGLLSSWGADASAATQRDLAAWSDGQALRCGLTTDEAATALPLARLARMLDGVALTALHASRRLQHRCSRLRFWQQRLADLPGGSQIDGNQIDGSEEGLARLEEEERLTLHLQLEADLPALLLMLPPATAQAALRRWRDRLDPLFHPRPPLDGRQLQALLGLAPGPQLGQLLHHLCRERAYGRLPTPDTSGVTDAAALAETALAARRWLAEQDGRHD